MKEAGQSLCFHDRPCPRLPPLQQRQHFYLDEGLVQKDDVWGLRPLATELSGERQGYFVVIDFTLPPQHITEFKFNLNIHERMFRYLLTTRIPEPVAKIK